MKQRKNKCVAFDKFFFYLWNKDLKNGIWWKEKLKIEKFYKKYKMYERNGIYQSKYTIYNTKKIKKRK